MAEGDSAAAEQATRDVASTVSLSDTVHLSGATSPSSAGARGSTTVASEVVEKIAGVAARSVPGVAELGGDIARFFNTVLDRVGLDEVGDATRGVSARVDGGSATVNVVLVISAGHTVATVTDMVRARIIEAVENYGLKVTAVNVTIDDIELNAPAPAPAPTPDA